MKLLCLLAIVGYVVASDPSFSPGYDGLNVYILEKWTVALEIDMQDLVKNISDATTLCAAADDKLNKIFDFFIARQTTKNKQHDELIASYQAQEKSLQHKVDEAKATEKQAIKLAESTFASVNDQIDNYLNGSGIKEVNEEQQTMIDNLDRQLNTSKSQFLSNLTDAIAELNRTETEAENKIRILGDFLKNRKCEYGTGYLSDGETIIDFKTRFTVRPNVTISLTGIAVHFDNYKDKYDFLSFSKQATAESTDYFIVDAYEGSKGQVDVKYVSCSWMACQFYDKEVDLEHPF